MDKPYLGEIRMFGGNFAPSGWAMCDGQLLSIDEHRALFELIGTTYGGDGTTCFALPNLQCRIPVHMGLNHRTGTVYQLGQMHGSETVKLNDQQMPVHSHPARCAPGGGSATSPENGVWSSSSENQYASIPNSSMSPLAVTEIGGSQPHNNMMPFLTVSFIIALEGINPTEPAQHIPFLGEIRAFAFIDAPRGWACCNGQLLPIDRNQAFYSLIGTTYGGNGSTTFALPNLRGRVPIHFNEELRIGCANGEELHKLTIEEMPEHNHLATGSSEAVSISSPGGNVHGKNDYNAYSSQSDQVMSPAAISNMGGSKPHSNMQPYTVLNFCIALQGIFPAEN